MTKPVIGGKYNWVNQPDRLVYLGKKGSWHQFKKIGDPREVWCEVLDEDLPSIEETKPLAATSTTPTSSAAVKEDPLQQRVAPWMHACFGSVISADKMERNHRFFEESTELVQANGMTRSEAHQLVDYTFDRPVGELNQEAGGVMITLAALCLASGIDMHEAGETELARIWTKVDAIRAKQAAKPKHSPLPATPQPATQPPASPVAVPEGQHKVAEGADKPPRFQWCCNTGGCGPCEVKRTEFEYFRSVTRDGHLIERRTFPQLVSACCSAGVFMFDNEKQEEVHPFVLGPDLPSIRATISTATQ